MNRKTVITVILLLCCILADAEKYDRGIAQMGAGAPVVASKGSFMVGGTIGCSGFLGSDYTLAIINNINTNGYSLNINPTFMYMVADNFGIGARLGYSRGLFDLASADLSAAGVTISVEDYNSLKHSADLRLFGRYFLPIGGSSRFAIFVEAGIDASAGQAKITDRQDGHIIGTYSTSMSAGLSVTPGVTAFITRNFALEASLGILGGGFQMTEQIKNQVYEGKVTLPQVYYSINPLALKVGGYFYF